MTGPADPTSPAAPAYLALGDSYTIGEGVEPAGRWPVQLAAALRGEGIAVADPRIIATTGWTTDELDAGIDSAHSQAAIGHDHALVSLHVDNLKGHNAHHQCETIFKAFGRAIRMAITPDPRSAGVIPSTKGCL